MRCWLLTGALMLTSLANAQGYETPPDCQRSNTICLNIESKWDTLRRTRQVAADCRRDCGHNGSREVRLWLEVGRQAEVLQLVRLKTGGWMAKTAKTYGTKEAAQKIGVSLRTLNRWLAAGKLKPSHGAPYEASHAVAFHRCRHS